MINIVIDSKELRDFSKKLEKLTHDNEINKKVFKTMTEDVYNYGKFVTPIKTGNLYASWEKPVYTFTPNTYVSNWSNRAEYGDWVDQGHSQEVGRYVPAIGKRLVRPFVPGIHFIDNVLEHGETIVNNSYEKTLVKEYKKYFFD